MKRTKKPQQLKQPHPPMGGFMPHPPDNCDASRKVRAENGVLCVDLAICVRTCDPAYCRRRNEYMKECKKERQRQQREKEEANEHS